MDGAAIMCALLLAHEPLTALVGDRVMVGTIPLATELPAVGIKEIGRVEADTVCRDSPATLVTARIQVTVYAATYPVQKAVLAAAKLGRGVFTGDIAGVPVRSVLRDSVGPDMSDEDAAIFEQSRDFKVTYIEPG